MCRVSKLQKYSRCYSKEWPNKVSGMWILGEEELKVGEKEEMRGFEIVING